MNLNSPVCQWQFAKRTSAVLLCLVLNAFPTPSASAAPTSTAYQLAFSVQPQNTTVGATMTNIVVQIQDKSGKSVLQSGTAISLALSEGSGLSGTTSVNSDASGKAKFSNLSIKQAGNEDVLQASANGLKSATSTAFTVKQGNTSTVLSSSANPSTYGQPVTFAATITPIAPAVGTPTGTVIFNDGATTLGTATLNSSGQATFTAAKLSATSASHSITANYSGDSNFSKSKSSALSQVITKAQLTVSGITASNKVYDSTTTATLNTSSAALVGVVNGDTVTLSTTGAKGTFADKNVGNAKTVTVSGLTLSGTAAGNYTLTQPTAKANITPRTLTVTAKGVNKVYDGTTAATVTLSDNRLSGDVLSTSYTAASFANKNVGKAKTVSVSGIAISGTDSGNYVLASTTAATTANITKAALTVTANNQSRVYGAPNPTLTATYSGFVGGETLTTSGVTGSPALTTTATVSSPVSGSPYVITAATGSLSASNYSFNFVNGTLTVTKADTTVSATSTPNPALTNQNITFTAIVSAVSPSTATAAGTVQFKSNGANLGSPVSLVGGQGSTSVLGSDLGIGSFTITAEYANSNGNFNASTGSLGQTQIVNAPQPPAPQKVLISLPQRQPDGSVKLSLSGAPNQTFVLEASCDMTHWTAISTNSADANGLCTFIDSNAKIYPRRLYRGVTPQQ